MGATEQDDPWERDATDDEFDTHLLVCTACGDRYFGSWRTQCGSRVTRKQIERAVAGGRLVKVWVAGIFSHYDYRIAKNWPAAGAKR